VLNQEFLKRQIEDKKNERVINKMSDAEYRLNRELLETIKYNPEVTKTQTNYNNKIF
jgi:hypothetical protein